MRSKLGINSRRALPGALKSTLSADADDEGMVRAG